MSNNKIQSINPTTEEVIKEFDLLTDDQLKSKLKLAEETFKSWKNSSFELRAQCMNRVAELLDQKSEKYGYTITEETGKTLYTQGISEPKKCAKWCRWYAENAKRILSDKVIKSESGKKTMIVHQPMGILLQIAPFNYPFLQCLRFLTACLMAGNVALIRHSHSVTLSALLIEQLFLEAGFPHGCVQVLLVTKDQVSHLIADPRIRGVTITGSTEAGKAIARQAGENVKKNVMELGGSDAYIICEDADLDKTIDECVKGRIVNNGQSCTSAKRFIVNEAIYNEFCEKFSAKMKSLKMGDPMKEDTDVGPMSRKDLRDNTHEYVLKSIADGAKLLCGGEIVQGMKGFFYPPTALCDVTTDNFAFKNEIFGPVAAIIKSKNDYHAIELCNASRYGLGGGVFTNDENRGERIAREMEVGLAFVNRIVTSMPNYPFGGVKDSGYGKECGEEGILEWCNTKSLIVK